MKIVIDTNIIISALIKNSLTRRLIFNKNFHLLTPSFSLTEIDKYKDAICKKAKINSKDFYILLEKIFDYIKIVNSIYYKNYLEKAKALIKDTKDVPFLACAMYFDCPIWSDDKGFQKQKEIKTFTTNQIILI